MQVRERTKIQSPEITDGVLVKQTLAGDQQAFEMLVRRYNSPLFNFICHCLGDYDMACDILQQVFLQLYISMPTLRTGEPLKAWLFQVARNRCLDELRRKRAIHFSELESSNDDDDLSPLAIMPDTRPQPDEIAEHHDLQHTLRRAIESLPPKFRSVVLLRYAGQLSFSEIGKTLNMPEATAKTYFQRARPLLRTALAAHRQSAVAS
ncbi:sigma-70 family RNA polymerase sigma factor [Ktedonosporobacter rubrisoli]|uniref:Sigma-70 family RNA polymerase sigma factor n=1 Tax=Ktedonosporobacter rubrisoli TaxID=2509675 RepID=A0A4P6JRM2_KTERU|nr:sigma-70 family RNA polymerase sigma factor [Ktedonosporobacter rubrisoli]QBD78119.1 sigma-70 family RNA polymerase sigma factor [Ktedonosporobacter rubrisoli]